MSIRALLFDCDGVIVDSEVIANGLPRDAPAAAGLHLDLAGVVDNFVDLAMDDPATRARALRAELPDGWATDLAERVQARLATGTPLVAAIEALLDRLGAAANAHTVASNGWPETMQITIDPHPAVRARAKHCGRPQRGATRWRRFRA